MSFEFYENILATENSSELTVSVLGERCAWVSLPPVLSNRLYDSHADIPCPLRISRAGIANNEAPGALDDDAAAASFVVAWAGAVCEVGCIGIPSMLAQCVNLRDGERVRVAECEEEFPVAESVSVEPADPDDWEVVELNAEHLEAVVLGQAGIACRSQKLPLWVHSTPVLLRVSRTVPDSPIVRLAPGTELYVAPRVRANGNARLLGDTNKNVAGSPNKKSTSSSVRCALRVAVARSGDANDVLIESGTLDALGVVSSGNVDIWAVPRSGHPAPKRVLRSNDTPTGHIALMPGTMREWSLFEDAHVALLLSTSPKTRTGRDVDNNAAPTESGINGGQRASTTTHRTRRSKQAPSNVPRVEEWLRPVTSDILRTLLPVLSHTARKQLAKWNAPRGGGVLLTGPPGSGKSACVAAVASLLHAHPDCVTHAVTVDCRAPAMSGVLERAFGEAARKAPSLVILEDLDIACPAEEGAEPGAGPVPGATAFAENLADILDALRQPAPEWGSTPGYLPSTNADTLAMAAIKSKANTTPHIPIGSETRSADGVFGTRTKEIGTASPVSDNDTSAPSFDKNAILFRSASSERHHNWAPIAVIATARDAGTIARCLLRAGRLDATVELPAPTAASRAAMLQSGLRSRGGAKPDAQTRAVLARVAEATDGYDAADVATLLDRAFLFAARRRGNGGVSAVGKPIRPAVPTGDAAAADDRGVVLVRTEDVTLTSKDLERAIQGYTPAAFWGAGAPRSSAGNGPAGWEDVGGARAAREALHEALELPLRHSALLAQAPLRLRTGVLLYGAPGTGKTHVIRAAIAAAGIRCISVSGPELLNKYIGASEAAVRDVFARAAAAAPSALFFDEFESFAPARGADSTGVTDRVVNQLLTELDGVGGLKGVTVLAATSRPDLVDPALLRPGRLDRLVRCDFPDNAERMEMLGSLSRKSGLHEDVRLNEISEQTDGFSPADLAALLGEAQLAAVHETLDEDAAADRGKIRTRTAPPSLRHKHLLSSLRGARPSVPPNERKRLETIYDRFTTGKNGAPTALEDSAKRATLA